MTAKLIKGTVIRDDILKEIEEDVIKIKEELLNMDCTGGGKGY